MKYIGKFNQWVYYECISDLTNDNKFANLKCICANAICT